MKKSKWIASGILILVMCITMLSMISLRKDVLTMRAHTASPSLELLLQSTKPNRPFNLSSSDLSAYNKVMFVAHPDDELLWAGRFLVEQAGWFIVCMTNVNTVNGIHTNNVIGTDYQTALADGTLTRKLEFESVMCDTHLYEEGNSDTAFTLGTGYLMLGYPDRQDAGFESTNPNSATAVRQDIRTVLMYKDWDMIVTHNTVGDSGNIQHRQINQYVRDVTQEPDVSQYDKLYYFGDSHMTNGNHSSLANPTISPQGVIHKKLIKLAQIYASQTGVISRYGGHFVCQQELVKAACPTK